MSNVFESVNDEIDRDELSLIQIRDNAMAIICLADVRLKSPNQEDKRVDDLMDVALKLMRQLQQHMIANNARVRVINDGLAEMEDSLNIGAAEITGLEKSLTEIDKRLKKVEEILEAKEVEQKLLPKKII